jgi:hypothetical protein
MPRDLYERESNHMRNRISLASGKFRVGVALAFLMMGATGCDHLLRVQDPDVVTPGQVSGPDKLSTNLGASIGAFQVAFGGDGSGGNEGLVNMTGLFSDEFTFAETFPTRKVVDQRNTSSNNSTLLTIFFNIEQARALGSTGLLRCRVACRGWSAGLVKSRPKLRCREDSLSPYGCLIANPAASRWVFAR